MLSPGRWMLTQVTPANPTIAMAAATVDQLSGGRFILGVGSSHRVKVEPEHGVTYAKPLTRVRESVEVIRRLGARVDFSDDHTATIDASSLRDWQLDPTLAAEIRGSFLLAAPVLARQGRAQLPAPGGDRVPDPGRASGVFLPDAGRRIHARRAVAASADRGCGGGAERAA